MVKTVWTPVICIPINTRHIFSLICHFLGILIYPHLFVEGSILVEGTNKYDRYSKLFITLVKDIMDDLKTMGEGYRGIGTDSCWKGVASMVASGCNVSPPIVSI